MSKYDEVLRPFTAAMDRELHANAHKGDRPGWMKMSAATIMLEILYHHSKLQVALDAGDGDRILEHTADVANLSMMLADVCGALSLAPPAYPVRGQATMRFCGLPGQEGCPQSGDGKHASYGGPVEQPDGSVIHEERCICCGEEL